MGFPKGSKKAEASKTEVHEAQAEVAAEQENEFTSKVHACKACGHHTKIHYEGRDRQCNTSGCRCNAFK